MTGIDLFHTCIHTCEVVVDWRVSSPVWFKSMFDPACQSTSCAPCNPPYYASGQTGSRHAGGQKSKCFVLLPHFLRLDPEEEEEDPKLDPRFPKELDPKPELEPKLDPNPELELPSLEPELELPKPPDPLQRLWLYYGLEKTISFPSSFSTSSSSSWSP